MSRVLPLACGALTLASTLPAGGFDYPKTKRIDHTDTYHGTVVADPYRWLEDDVRESKEVADWVKAQNKVTFEYLRSLPQRKAIQKRLKKLWNFEKLTAPVKVGGRYFQQRNDGLQNQYVLYTLKDMSGFELYSGDSLSLDENKDDAQVLLDPNTWAKDGTQALGGWVPSKDGRYLAYGVADGGSDWRTWYVKEIESGRLLEDKIEWVKFSSVSWTPDSRGFFYSRYDAPEKGAAFQKLNLNQKVFYHRIGTHQDQDVLVYQRPDHPDWGFSCEVTEDGRYLVMTIWKGTDSRYRVAYKDLREPFGMPLDLITGFDNDYSFIGNDGPNFYFKTDLDSPKRRVISIDIRKPNKKNWKELIPESNDTLTSVSLVGNLFVAQYLKDARTVTRVHHEDGTFVREVSLPGIGSAYGFRGHRNDTETFYNFQSFTTPPSIYRYDVITGKSTLISRANVDFDPDQFEVSQVFYKSKDGTKVPMFLAHKKGIPLDGTNPTLLYGYGGLNSSQTPYFSISRLNWMEMGGVLAIANIRGGGEYGVEWHKAGTKLKKQNVFDDFIAAAEWLHKKGYSKPSTLAIQGGSNGGLLVGAVMTQRPELFGACLPSVGVMDMLRFHKFTAGRFWVDDYGSAENPEEFKALYAYSPYHNIQDGVAYPPTLITTADTDDRVVPGHSFKFAAALQKAHKGDNPVLIRIETRAGHGAGTPTSKLIEQIADKWAFLMATVGSKE